VTVTGPEAEISVKLREIDRAESVEALRHSVAGRVGIALETVSRWCGFDWRTNVALLAGFAAKEVIISTFGTAYSLGKGDAEQDVSLSRRLALDPDWNRLKAFALIVFIMLYAPCFVTVTCIVKESGALGWGLFSMVFNTTVAFLIVALIYQGGRWMGLA
jgi:ferrous iron transport protein B